MATRTVIKKIRGEEYERTIMDKPKMEKTSRGFPIMHFEDMYGSPCSLQESSLATESAIWFGVDDASPKVLRPGQGWIPYPIPEEVSLSTRMHLTQDQVKVLLPFLQRFAKTGELK